MAPATSVTPRRLLVLDDDPLIGRAVRLVAANLGFEVRAFQEAVGFLEAVDDWAPTHVALDLIMPGTDGVEMLRILGARRSLARVILMSGVGSRVLDAARRSASAHGLALVGALQKPFTAAALTALLCDDAPAEVPHTTRQRPPAGAFEPSHETIVAAIANDELVLHFQPKLACASPRVEGFEALVRWVHPTAGLIPPDRFIPIAEQTGCITQLTLRVFELAVAWLAGLSDPSVTVSVNLSGRDIQTLALADDLERRCRAAGVEPERVVLELTETSAMGDPISGLDLLTRLRVKGFHLSLDDFGTGYSSMVQLARLPFSELKIDRSFVASALSSSEARTIVRTTVDLAHGLGLAAVAEGVEDATTLAFLGEIGCDLAQGYYIARPLPAADAARWLVGHADGTIEVAPVR